MRHSYLLPFFFHLIIFENIIKIPNIYNESDFKSITIKNKPKKILIQFDQL